MSGLVPQSASDENVAQASCMTFSVRGEDHTLGNALRFMLCQRRDVEFAGYSIPHPMLDEMNIRLQCHSRPAVVVLKEAVGDARELFEHVRSTYQSALKTYNEANATVDMTKV